MPEIGDLSTQGASTVAKQNVMITALQLIDDLQKALFSVDTDKLNVHIKSTDTPAGDATAANQTTMITALQILDNLVGALNSVATDKLDIHLLTSAVTIGDATAANQTTMITALQLIDDLRGALGSVNTDDLQVDVKTMPTTTVQPTNGNKIFSFGAVVEEALEDLSLSSGSNTLSGTSVPANKIYVITFMAMRYTGTSPTAIEIAANGLATSLPLFTILSPVSTLWYGKAANLFLQEGDNMEISTLGATAGDDLFLRYAGYEMDI